MGFIKKAAVASAMATAVVAMVGQGGAFGAAAGGAVGLGTISPGLPTSGCANQSVTFDSAVLVYADTTPAVVTANTHFSGNSSICETLNAGQGSGTLSGGLSGTVDYSRTGNVVTIGGTINGHAGAGACLFVPTSVNPVQSYALVCVAASTS